MVQALAMWRLYPRQIRADLQHYYPGRHIKEWHTCDFTMSSSELLDLLDGLPDDSQFKGVSERFYRVVEKADGEIYLHRAVGAPPAGVKVVAEFVDWTFDRKLEARTVREFASLRAEMRPPGQGYEPDLAGVTEPLHAILVERQRAVEAENRKGAKAAYRSAFYKQKPTAPSDSA